VTTDKTGTPTTVTAEEGRFTIGVDGHTVGLAEYADRDSQRIFTHTEVDSEFEGRGLATILVGEALQQTRDAGLRIVPVCKLVANFVEKHDEYADLVDPVDTDIKRWLSGR
jgi:predicted GNAT family acetyltransferase